MRYLLAIALFVVLVGKPAHAMGVYTTLDAVAWNDDGTSALVIRDTSSSATAGGSRQYLLVTAGDKKSLVVAFTDTSDPDKATEHVDAKACAKAADTLASALAAKHFKGVAIHKEQCGKPKREVVAIAADAARLAALAWVASPSKRTPTVRETAAWDAVRAELKVSPGGADVASLSGKLVLIFSGENGDSSWPGHAAAYAGAQRFVDDLRSN